MTAPPTFDSRRRPITTDRPRLLGTRQYLRDLARQRPQQYQRLIAHAAATPSTAPSTMPSTSTRPRRRRNPGASFYGLNARIFALAISYVVDADAVPARAAVDLVLKNYIDRPIESGHVTFAHSLARCAIVYDLCHDLWTADERLRFQKYVHATIAANVDSEPSVFHNGWYGYKHWGYGMAAYALYHDDPEAPKILADLEHAYLNLAVPALKLAGDGGGWAEGFYIHYWLTEWLIFCETARAVEGVDYYAAAPEFFAQRAIAGIFECYPPLEKNTHQPIPMGDSHGRQINNERDKALAARRILAAYYKNDPAHQAVHAFNLQTPTVALPDNAYMDFLYNDTDITPADLDAFKLSHISPGAGFVYARSSWKEDATHFFFKSGRRFTSHQHLDNGHFMIYKNQDLLGDGGHYDSFDTDHAVNYYLRTIAHNSILIFDPHETFPKKSPQSPKGIRDGPPAQNDGGQYYPWSTTTMRGAGNGVAFDVPDWNRYKKIMEIATLPAAKDHGQYLYCAGDFTQSYSPHKAKSVTRQIVFLRPNTFIVFDRVEATNPRFKKSFLLQTAKIPEQKGPHWVVTNNNARLFIQSLAPADATIELFHGDNLYTYAGQSHPPKHLDPPAPECRMHISPAVPRREDHFLHVLTAADAQTQTVPLATCKIELDDLVVSIESLTIRFALRAP